MERVGGIREVNSADRIDQLNALRFQMHSVKFNLSRPNSGEISENGMPRTRQEIQKEETPNRYVGADRKVEIEAIGELGAFKRIHFSGIPDGGL